MRRIAASLGAVCIAAVVTLFGTPAAADNNDPTDLGITGSVTSLDGYTYPTFILLKFSLHNYGPNTINATRTTEIWAPGGTTIRSVPRDNTCTVLSSTHIRCTTFGMNYVDGHNSTPTTGMPGTLEVLIKDPSKVWTCGKITVTYANDPDHSNDTGYLRLTQHGQPSSCSAKKPSPKPSPKPAPKPQTSTVKAVALPSSTAGADVSPTPGLMSEEPQPSLSESSAATDPVTNASPVTELAGDSSGAGIGTIMAFIAGLCLVLIGAGLVWWRRRSPA